MKTILNTAIFLLISQLFLSCSDGEFGNNVRSSDSEEGSSAASALSSIGLYGQTALSGSTVDFGTTQSDACLSTITDSDRNIYCAGNTNGAIDSSEAADATGDAFIMKMDKDGNLLWVTQLGSNKAAVLDSSSSDVCYSITLDDDGNVYCAGETSSGLSETNGGGSDAFVAKLDTNGNIIWISQLGGDTDDGVIVQNASGNEQCYGVKVDSDGNVYCAGNTSGALGEANAGITDIFFTKLNSSGAVQWVKQFGSATVNVGGKAVDASAQDSCYGLDIDSSGNLYCAGRTSGDFAEPISGVFGDADIIFAMVDSTGAPQWVAQLGTVTGSGDNSATDECYSITVSNDGNHVYCVGHTAGTPGETNAGGNDIVAVKLDGSGNLLWISQLGDVKEVLLSSDFSQSESCAGAVGVSNNGTFVDVDSDGNLYATCATAGGAVADTNGGGFGIDVFIFKMKEADGSVEWMTQLGSSIPGSNGHEIPFSLHVDNGVNLIVSGLLIHNSGGFMGGVDLGAAGSIYNPFLFRMGLDGSFSL
ncbi:putative exported protein [Halobacteriovorax marinus SJ]|uniref:Exported protein n=1 Tax=Halobacteriovorax marinus (strain ATCC BAA-682 / DSM 15412 / SJ) TaxID=862908 RepID=E1WYI4_HALMS|nr:SBBP repeat-containing protein [Halobacteriovorax marinus]CBW26032.1 putative exported protein [Halobacteriovorax marinus SJ]